MPRPHEVSVLKEEFTATVVVRHHKAQKQANGNGYFDDPAEVFDGELLSVTLRSDSLEGLKAKLHAHIGLVEEE